MAFSNGGGRARKTLRKIALTATIIFGFVSIIFSRDFDGAGHLFHEPKDEGIAHADAPSCGDSNGDSTINGGGDSGSGSSADSGDTADSGTGGDGDGGDGDGGGDG